jgi:uncharacterized membrane-anchored protein YhcB (DUF1043 family)
METMYFLNVVVKEVNKMWLWLGIAFVLGMLVMTFALSLCKAASKEDQYIELEYERLYKNNKNKL